MQYYGGIHSEVSKQILKLWLQFRLNNFAFWAGVSNKLLCKFTANFTYSTVMLGSVPFVAVQSNFMTSESKVGSEQGR